jgi:hypothetical protein
MILKRKLIRLIVKRTELFLYLKSDSLNEAEEIL